MVNKIMYQKIQHFKRKGFAKADIIRETGLNKRTVFKYYDMSEKKYARYIEKVRYRSKIFEPYQPYILNLYQVNNFQSMEKSAVYDYLEKKLGSLPGTERSFRNYISFLVETEQLNSTKKKKHMVALEVCKFKIRCFFARGTPYFLKTLTVGKRSRLSTLIY